MALGSPGCDTAAPAPVTRQPRRGGRGRPELTASCGPAVKRRPLRFRRLRHHRHHRLSQAPRGTGGRDGRPARQDVEAAASRRGPNGPGLTPSLRSTGTEQWMCGRGLGCDSEPPSPGCDSGATNSAVSGPPGLGHPVSAGSQDSGPYSKQLPEASAKAVLAPRGSGREERHPRAQPLPSGLAAARAFASAIAQTMSPPLPRAQTPPSRRSARAANSISTAIGLLQYNKNHH